MGGSGSQHHDPVTHSVTLTVYCFGLTRPDFEPTTFRMGRQPALLQSSHPVQYTLLHVCHVLWLGDEVYLGLSHIWKYDVMARVANPYGFALRCMVFYVPIITLRRSSGFFISLQYH